MILGLFTIAGLIYLPFIEILLCSFSSTDLKFCSCSDDGTVKVWDFARCQEERSLAGKCIFFAVSVL